MFDMPEGFRKLFGSVAYHEESRVLYDLETGEVLKMEDLDTSLLAEHGLERTSELPVATSPVPVGEDDLKDEVDSALNRLQEARLALEANAKKRKEITERLDRIDRQLRTRVEYIKWKYGALFNRITEEFGRGDSKTYVSPYGKLIWRLTRGSTKVIDLQAALAFLKESCPEAVKVTTKEDVLVSNIPDEMKESLPPGAFKVTGPDRELRIE